MGLGGVMYSRSHFEGMHTQQVQPDLNWVILFIISEVMFFVGFSWAFFSFQSIPAIQDRLCMATSSIAPFNHWAFVN
jgi:heme/copper-type cytochrome/quinol oxidase subunit 3